MNKKFNFSSATELCKYCDKKNWYNALLCLAEQIEQDKNNDLYAIGSALTWEFNSKKLNMTEKQLAKFCQFIILVNIQNEPFLQCPIITNKKDNKQLKNDLKNHYKKFYI